MVEGRSKQAVSVNFEGDLETFVSHFEAKVFALYELLVPGGEGAVDCLARAFHGALRTYRAGESDSLEALLYREVIKEATTYLQEHGCCVPTDCEWKPAVLPSAPGSGVDSAVHGLPIEYRTVFSLRDVLRVPADTVQQILHLTDLEVRAYLHRARLMIFRMVREARA